MSLQTTTHLNFRGNARQALAFYHSVFDGHLSIITYQDAGNTQPASEAEQVMWGQVVADSGFRVMAYDVPSSTLWNPGENSVFVAVQGDTVEEIAAYWGKLSAGATIVQPLSPSQWSPLYGMLKDRYGVTWVLSVVSQYATS